jgi:hypothetical protein
MKHVWCAATREDEAWISECQVREGTELYSWRYGGDAEFTYYALTKEEAKEALTKRLEEIMTSFAEAARKHDLLFTQLPRTLLMNRRNK